jgi:hypothetical protein
MAGICGIARDAPQQNRTFRGCLNPNVEMTVFDVAAASDRQPCGESRRVAGESQEPLIEQRTLNDSEKHK